MNAMSARIAVSLLSVASFLAASPARADKTLEADAASLKSITYFHEGGHAHELSGPQVLRMSAEDLRAAARQLVATPERLGAISPGLKADWRSETETRLIDMVKFLDRAQKPLPKAADAADLAALANQVRAVQADNAPLQEKASILGKDVLQKLFPIGGFRDF